MAIIVYTPEPARTVLGLVASYAAENGLPVPTALMGSPDAGVLQLRTLLQRVGDFCVSRGLWSFCRRQALWTSTGIESQGHLAHLAPDGFTRITPGSFWDRTADWQIKGPINDAEWDLLRQRQIGQDHNYRLYLNQLEIWPAVPVGHELAFQYRSNHWLSSPGTFTSKSTISDDSDFVLLPKDLMILGLDFYWRRAKELPYLVEEGRFFDALASHMSGDSSSPIVRLDEVNPSAMPGIVVPRGNWLSL